MQEAVAGAGIDKQKTLGDGGKGHRSSAPSVTPTPSRSKPTARPVLHKKAGQLAAFLRALAGWRARATSGRLPACETAKACKELSGARIQTHFRLLSKNKAVLWVKNATEKTGNSRFRYRKDRVL